MGISFSPLDLAAFQGSAGSRFDKEKITALTGDLQVSGVSVIVSLVRPKGGGMPRITIRNKTLGTEARANLAKDGVLRRRQVDALRDRLGVPPGCEWCGPVGEDGPQRPPEAPGWEYRFQALEDGTVKAVPHPVAAGKAVAG